MVNIFRFKLNKSFHNLEVVTDFGFWREVERGKETHHGEVSLNRIKEQIKMMTQETVKYLTYSKFLRKNPDVFSSIGEEKEKTIMESIEHLISTTSEPGGDLDKPLNRFLNACEDAGIEEKQPDLEVPKFRGIPLEDSGEKRRELINTNAIRLKKRIEFYKKSELVE